LPIIAAKQRKQGRQAVRWAKASEIKLQCTPFALQLCSAQANRACGAIGLARVANVTRWVGCGEPSALLDSVVCAVLTYHPKLADAGVHLALGSMLRSGSNETGFDA
jgi:hypothetical protein